MSFCPNKDIHSVYLDNELPDVYKTEYEEHVKNCPACQKELESLKAVRSLLHSDSESLNVSEKDLDDSYERLKIKMMYSKNAGKAKKSVSFRPGYIAAAAAAAAVFALIIPVRMNTNVQNGSASGATANVASLGAISGGSSSISANNVSLGSGRNVLVSGNIKDKVILPNSGEEDASSLAKNVKELEVLRPELEDETISIRITVPGVGEIPVVTEINVPMAVISGRLQ